MKKILVISALFAIIVSMILILSACRSSSTIPPTIHNTSGTWHIQGNASQTVTFTQVLVPNGGSVSGHLGGSWRITENTLTVTLTVPVATIFTGRLTDNGNTLTLIPATGERIILVRNL